jgi:hypothetical protein
MLGSILLKYNASGAMPHSLHGAKTLSLVTVSILGLIATLRINDNHEMTLRMTTLQVMDSENMTISIMTLSMMDSAHATSVSTPSAIIPSAIMPSVIILNVTILVPIMLSHFLLL